MPGEGLIAPGAGAGAVGGVPGVAGPGVAGPVGGVSGGVTAGAGTDDPGTSIGAIALVLVENPPGKFVNAPGAINPPPVGLPVGVKGVIVAGAGKTGPMSPDEVRAVDERVAFVTSVLRRLVFAARLTLNRFVTSAFRRLVFTTRFVEVVLMNPELGLPAKLVSTPTVNPRGKFVDVLNTSGRAGVMISTLWDCPRAVLGKGAA